MEKNIQERILGSGTPYHICTAFRYKIHW